MTEKKSKPTNDEIERFGTVGQIMDSEWTPNEVTPVEPILPPKHPEQPDFPQPGIYFGMPEEEYHAVPALSASGLKKLSASSMDFWANSWMNLDREERESAFLDYGKAVHAFVLEGEQAYLSRYALELDSNDFENVITSSEEIKAAIRKFSTMAPVQPKGTTKQALIDQLDDLGRKYAEKVNLEGTVPQLRERIAVFKESQPVAPVTRVTEEGPDGEQTTRPAQKADFIAQLLDLNPDAKIWDHMIEQHLASNEGKSLISAKDDYRIRLAARMILAHREIGPLFSDGHAEVSIFWFCPSTGVPMKARLDWLTLADIVDLKTFSNKNGVVVDRAIERAIANYRYNVQHCVYDEAVEAAKSLIREIGEAAIFHCDKDVNAEQVDTDARDAWCREWASREGAGFVFVFQQSGIAPVTRGKRMPREGMGVFGTTARRIEELKSFWAANVEVYGLDPWVDTQPIQQIDDEDLPLWATEI